MKKNKKNYIIKYLQRLELKLKEKWLVLVKKNYQLIKKILDPKNNWLELVLLEVEMMVQMI